MTEAFLQYVWRYNLLKGELITTSGLPVEILRVGELNTDAGPDFIDARLMINGTLWAGNIEIHVKSSDWKLHKHTTDKKYNNIVLHVVWEHDCEVSSENGEQLLTMEIKPYISPDVLDKYEKLTSPHIEGELRCSSEISNLPSFKITAMLERLSIERIERKSADVKRLLADARGSWETCCYWLLAKYFGGKTNGFMFELLAKSTDQRLLARWKDNPQRIEALLFGQAGMLAANFTDEYPRQLQMDYEALQRGAQLKPIDGFLWKTFRLRPSSFPTLRISQFAQLVCRSSNLFQFLLEQTNVLELEKIFSLQASSYWDTHYQFDVCAKSSPKRLGKSFADLLIINAWIPLLMEYGNQHGLEKYKDQALDLLSQLSAEDNKIVRLWSGYGIMAENAVQSQALIQLYNEYCKGGRCINCQIGYQLMKGVRKPIIKKM